MAASTAKATHFPIAKRRARSQCHVVSCFSSFFPDRMTTAPPCFALSNNRLTVDSELNYIFVATTCPHSYRHFRPRKERTISRRY